jgi:hypothetical protein
MKTILQISQKVTRYQDKLWFKYRHPVKHAWYWLRKVASFSTWVYLVAILITGSMAAAEKVANLSVENRQSLGLVTKVADWINIRFPFERLTNWLEVAIDYIAASPALLSFLKFSLDSLFWIVGAVLLWLLPRVIANWQETKKETKHETLRTALAPAPSGQDILSRFLIVTIIVWLGLGLGESFARSIGWCLASVNNECSHTYVVTFIWLTIAVACGVLSIWRMVEMRRKRDIARRTIKRKSQPASKTIRQALRVFGFGVLGFMIVMATLAFYLEKTDF